jgi:WD repeat-containing protein 19
MTGEYSNAKGHYQQAIESLMGILNMDLELACRSGIARCTLQLGDIRQGRSMVIQINSPQLYKEAAHILEALQQLTEAAEMYERAGQYERAASIYIQTKNFNAATPLMAKVSSSKLHLQFAKAKEAEGRWAGRDVAPQV